jgi:uncharacterized protein
MGDKYLVDKNLLIIGIDPGTTLGYALLDISGKPVLVGSSKLLEFNALLKLVTERGFPVVVASDKKNAPEFVSRFATKCGARLIIPEEDMLVDDKRAAAKAYEPLARNDHERDALAAALHALSRLRPLLTKIDTFTEHYKKKHLERAIKKLVLTHDGMSIRLALDMLEKPQKEEVKIIKAAVEKKQYSPEYSLLYKKLLEYEQQNSFLRNKIGLYEGQLASAGSSVRKLEKKLQSTGTRINDEKAKKLLQARENIINMLTRQLQAEKDSATILKRDILLLNRMMPHAAAEHMVLAKKLDSLGNGELERKAALLSIRHGDVLCVRDGTTISRNSLEILHGKIRAIITDKKSRALEGFAVIQKSKLKPVFESEHFMLLDRSEFEKELDAAQVFEKVLSEYKEGREKSLKF